MPDVTTKTFAQLLQGQAAAVQARAAGLVDFTVGSIPRAIAEAVAGVALWLQGLILVLLATTRAATSSGADLDSWIADFGAAPQAGDASAFARLGAQAASGQQTFSRLTTTGTAIVRAGGTVQSIDGTQQYTVTADPSNAGYSTTLGGYVMADGVSSVDALVVAATAGAAGNAVPGAVNTITSAMPGIDATSNASAFTNGADAEPDTALRPRFRKFIGALRRATPLSLQAAVEALKVGVTCTVVENQLLDGTPRRGFVYLVVDDGSGTPPTELLTAAAAAVDEAHAAGIEFAVYAPTKITITVAATVTTSTGSSTDHAAAALLAKQALQAYLSGLGVGQTVYWSRVWQVLQDASDDILEVATLTVNGGTSDIAISTSQVAKPGTLTVA